MVRRKDEWRVENKFPAVITDGTLIRIWRTVRSLLVLGTAANVHRQLLHNCTASEGSMTFSLLRWIRRFFCKTRTKASVTVEVRWSERGLVRYWSSCLDYVLKY